MIVLNVDVTKIDKSKLYKGKKGTYLEMVLIDKPDDFGNDGFVAQGTTKEERESGVRGAIIGNWKDTGKRQEPQKPQTRQYKPQPKPPVDPDLEPSDDDGVPF